jgi:hypothetical protein
MSDAKRLAAGRSGGSGATNRRDRPGSYKRVSLLAAGRISETTSTARLMLGAAAPEMSAMSGLRGQSDMQTLIISGSRRRLIAQATPCTLRRKLSVHF